MVEQIELEKKIPENGSLLRRTQSLHTESRLDPVPKRKRAGAQIQLLTFVLALVLFSAGCRRENAPAATPSPTPTLSPSPSATPTPTLTPSPTSSPSPSPTVAATAPPTPTPTPTATPVTDPFADGLRQLLDASQTAFRDLRGKYLRNEKGSGPDALFKTKKIFEGSLLFGGAVSAEIEEVYFHPGQPPAYNYHLYFQPLSTRESIQRYDDLRTDLNHVLATFDHTFGDRYDAWQGHDPLKTAVLLSSQSTSGAPEIQVHVAFESPQWLTEPTESKR